MVTTGNRKNVGKNVLGSPLIVSYGSTVALTHVNTEIKAPLVGECHVGDNKRQEALRDTSTQTLEAPGSEVGVEARGEGSTNGGAK